MIIWLNTPLGIGIGYDSIFYISAADNLLNGLGLSRMDGFGNIIPLTHFPPLYSFSLAGMSFVTGLDIDVAARILAVVSFGLLVFLCGWLVYIYTRSSLASILSAALALVSPVLIDLSFMAMTESIFLVVLLTTLHMLNRFLLTEKGWLLFTTAGLAAAAYLLRYVGLSVVLVGVLALLILGKRPIRRRLIDATVFASIGIIPILVYYLRNWLSSGSFTNRVILYHPPTANQLRQGVATISAWILPARIDQNLRIALFILIGLMLLVLFILDFRQGNSTNEDQHYKVAGSQFVILLGLFIIVYLGSLVLSLTFFDASTRLNDRILSPVYITGLLAGFVIIWNSNFYQKYVLVQIGMVGAILVFIGVNLLQGINVANQMRLDGKGFSGRVWRSSETIDQVKDLPQDTLIYTNEAFAVYYLTGKSANWIPESFDPVKGLQADDYKQHISKMQEDIIRFNGALVIFNTIAKANVYAPIQELTSQLQLWSQNDDGSIYLRPE